MEYIKAALHILKACATEQQRLQYGVLLAAAAPPLLKRGDKAGMIRKVAARLQVPYGSHFIKGTKTLTYYAFTKAVAGRVVFISEAEQAAKPLKELKVGDRVLCRGQLAELSAYDPLTGQCSVTFRAEDSDVSQTVNYLTRFGNGEKSARLQQPPALLQYPPRKTRKDAITQEVLDHVAVVYETNCPTSPHQRDRCRGLLASRCWEEK